jgi:ketosteroid isomerase-like protein
MKIVTTVCAVLLAATSICGAPEQNANDRDEAVIMTLENAWNVAEARRDVSALNDLLGANLVYTDIDGSFMNKQQFLDSTKNSPVDGNSIENENVAVHMYGNSAVVSGAYREKGTMHGKPLLRRGRFTDTWVKQNNTWLCVASQSTLITH